MIDWPNRNFFHRRVILFSLTFLFLNSVNGQPNCRPKVEDYIIRLKTALHHFIPDPGNDAERNRFLQALQESDQQIYSVVEGLSREAQANMSRDTTWLLCFQQEFLKVQPGPRDENIISWSSHLFKRFVPLKFVSPEFERGIGIHVDVNQGAADLGSQTEAYSFATRVLLGYTFASSQSGGRYRLFGGVSTYYFDSRFHWFANPRLEFRIKDVDNKLLTFGNIKAIVDANFGETWIAGGGLGLELHNFGAQILYQRQGEQKSSHLLVGLFYRFLK
jgi:hypothetical protein